MSSESFTFACPMNSASAFGRSESSTTDSSLRTSGVVISARDIRANLALLQHGERRADHVAGRSSRAGVLERAPHGLLRVVRGIAERDQGAHGIGGYALLLRWRARGRFGADEILHLVAQLPAKPVRGLLSAVPLDGSWLTTASAGGVSYTVITAANDRGVLYGVFGFLRKIALGEPVAALHEKQSPYAPVRWANEWNNLDGSIERGYGGRSIFWDKLQAREDLSRVGEYGRLLASLGISACSINNVNANPRVLAADFIPQVVRIAEAFRPWGVRVALAIDFGSPKTLGGLDTFDPLDAKVASWWKDRVDALYTAV